MKFFQKNNFKKRECIICNISFWSVDSFICKMNNCYDNSFSKITISKKEIEKTFFNYFISKKYLKIKETSIIPKWRKDVFFIQASIYRFQPSLVNTYFKTKNNKFVINQTSIRFDDLKNIGKENLRHLSSFKMMGFHKFFIPYSKYEKTIEEMLFLSLFFFNKLKVKKEDIVFIEDIWEGGGNRGKCYEVFIGGEEVATLVLMDEVLINNNYEKMKYLVIDTGFGLERIYSRLNQFNSFNKLKIFKDKKIKTINLEDNFLYLDSLKTIKILYNNKLVPSNKKQGYYLKYLLKRISLILLKNNLNLINSFKEDILNYWLEEEYFKLKYFYENLNKFINLKKEEFIFEVESKGLPLEIISLLKGVEYMEEIKKEILEKNKINLKFEKDKLISEYEIIFNKLIINFLEKKKRILFLNYNQLFFYSIYSLKEILFFIEEFKNYINKYINKIKIAKVKKGFFDEKILENIENTSSIYFLKLGKIKIYLQIKNLNINKLKNIIYNNINLLKLNQNKKYEFNLFF